VSVFGEKLRQQRERRGISLDAISTTTKISTRMLRAIEDEHFDQLPGGVFNKGFVRAYARQIGLDEDEVVTDYLTALRESQIHSQAILPNFRAPAAQSAAQATSTPHRNTLQQDGSVAIPPSVDRRVEERRREPRRRDDRELRHLDGPGAGYHSSNLPRPDHLAQDRPDTARPEEDRSYGAHLHDSRPSKVLDEEVVPSSRLSFLSLDSSPSSSHLPDSDSGSLETQGSVPAGNPSSRIPWGQLAGLLLLITLALTLWNLHRRRQAAVAFPPSTSQPATSQTYAAPVSSTTSVSAATPQPSGAVKPGPISGSHAAQPAPTTPSAPIDADGNPPVARHHAPAVAPKPSQPLSLVIRAAQTSWISITADGQPVGRETLIAPANTSVRAAREIVIRTGNAAGISFLFNGKEVPASGDPGEVRTYTFDASGVSTSAALPPSTPPS
jgi:cytoskeletal protein RodZ